MKLAHLFIMLAAISLWSCGNQSNEETNQWRGPNRDGIFAETNLLDAWPEGGPELLWKYDSLGTAYSSAAIGGNKVFTLGTVDSTNILYAFNFDGELLFEKPLGKAWMKTYPGARNTPLIYNGKAYIFDGLGVMFCVDMEGEILWKRDLLNEYNAENIQHGFHENLIIDGEKLFVTLGGKEANVLALNKDTGETIWVSKGIGELSAYASPNIINHNGRKYYITFSFNALLSIDVENGELAWSEEMTEPRYGIHGNVPHYKDGKLFIVEGWKYGSKMFEIAEDGESVELLWKHDSTDIQMGDAVVINDEIFTASVFNRCWYCLDWNTGEEKYRVEDIREGTVIAADGKLILLTYTGDIYLVKPENNDFTILGQFKAPGKRPDHFSQPVIKDGVLYVRYDKTICAYNIKK